MLHLGCGLDSRYYRLDPGPGVEWYDVDYPDVADLRRQLFPAREHCHVVAASVTDPAWLADVPADRPTLMIGEGLTMYLTEADGVALLRRIVDHAPSGELQFDAFNRFGHQDAVDQHRGAAIGGDAALGHRRARRHPQGGARPAAAGSGCRRSTRTTFAEVPLAYRVMAKVMSAVAEAALHGAVPPLRVLSAASRAPAVCPGRH